MVIGMNELKWNILRTSYSAQSVYRQQEIRDWFQKEQVWNCESGEENSFFSGIKKQKKKIVKNVKKGVDIFFAG